MGKHPFSSLIVTFWRTYTRVGVSRSAAALSYFLILTLFPLLLCVHQVVVRFQWELENIFQPLAQLLPPGTLALVQDYLAYVSQRQSPALFWAGLTTILVSASAAVRTLLHTMDSLYQTPHPHRGRFVLSIGLSALFLATIYLSVAVILTGDWFILLLEGHAPPASPLHLLSRLWQALRYLLLFAFVLLLVLILYRAGAPYPQVSHRRVLSCGLFTAWAIALGSGLFSLVIGLSARYELVYGSLAGLIILLVWLYFCGTVLLLGPVISQILAQNAADSSG